MVSEEKYGERARDQVTVLQQVVSAPASAPTLTPGTGGSGALPTMTLYAKVTFVSAFGESAASPEQSASITGTTGKCTVTSPSAPSGFVATGYNVYAAGASGAEVLQNAAPVAIGTNYEIDSLASGFGPPSQNPASILPAGTVLGLTGIGSSATYTANSGNTGNFTCGTVTVKQGALEGTYTGEFIAATVFNLYDPSGKLVGEGATGTAFGAGELGFTITAGGTAAVAGDGFTIALAANANVGLYAPLNLVASDGTQNAAGILFNEIDCSQANRKCTVIDRVAEVNGSELIYPASATTAQVAAINAQLVALGVVVR